MKISCICPFFHESNAVLPEVKTVKTVEDQRIAKVCYALPLIAWTIVGILFVTGLWVPATAALIVFGSLTLLSVLAGVYFQNKKRPVRMTAFDKTLKPSVVSKLLSPVKTREQKQLEKLENGEKNIYQSIETLDQAEKEEIDKKEALIMNSLKYHNSFFYDENIPDWVEFQILFRIKERIKTRGDALVQTIPQDDPFIEEYRKLINHYH